jgi:AcrR family transcriptional regulator
MMAEHGPQGLTLSDVARRAGVNRGTAYQHFATRDSLIAAVLEATFRSTKATLDAGAPDTLDAWIERTVRYMVEHPDLVRLSLFRLLGGVPNPREDLWADYLGRVRTLVRGPGGQPDADADMLAVILLGGTLLWSIRVHTGAEPRSSTERYLREVKRLLLFGAIRPDIYPDLVRAVDRAAPAGPRPPGGPPERRPRH